MAKQYHHGDLKKAAIEKAAEIIQKKGEADFTLREVAKSLKVSHTAVYRHFQSKQELLSHVAEQGFQKLTSDFAVALSAGRNPRSQLEAMGQAYIEFAHQNSGYYRSMFHQELRCSAEQRVELLEAGEKAFAALEDVLRAGMRAGQFRKGDSFMAARSVWAGIHGFSSLLIDGQFQGFEDERALNRGIRQHLLFLQKALK